MPNVVFDANVIVSAALKQDSTPERALLLARSHDVLCLSAPIVEELRDVLGRPKFRTAISDDRRAIILGLLLAKAEFFETMETVSDCRDRKDNKYLELALACRAGVIVSGDPDLLVLDPWRGVRVLRPSDYILHLHDRIDRPT